MSFSLSSPHEQFLVMRSMRNEVLAANIANADTPNYKARDYDFAAALKQAGKSQSPLAMKTTDAKHQASVTFGGDSSRLAYRVPTQPTLDGNTVEVDVEQAQFAENALQYRAALSYLNSHFRGLSYAIRGSE